ncbi:MAG: ankyrin repeat domain-containing protein [Planctomycetes bacterium]|jgi:ankyrin repeat protein|nr:ankyrin repeat domain-containing protein [Planctomycetota bacterium]
MPQKPKPPGNDLFALVMTGNWAAIRAAILAGTPVDARLPQDRTVLHEAAERGALAVVDWLLQHGADVSARDYRQTTPLQLAAGAELNATDSTGRTPLWYAAAAGTRETATARATIRLPMLQLLIELGADPRIRAAGTQGSAIDAASAKGRGGSASEWPEGLAVLALGPNSGR